MSTFPSLESFLALDTSTLLLFVVTMALVIAALFINGATDAPSAIATVIATGVMSPRVALILGGLFNLIGTYFGAKVAITIAGGIVATHLVTLPAICAAMIAIIGWGIYAWKTGKPISKSHALIAGLAGAGLASGGWGAYTEVWATGWWNGWTKTLVGLIFSPLLGFGGALLVGKLVIFFFARMHSSTGKRLFDYLQVVSAMAMATSHGSNDGGKFIGIIQLVLILVGLSSLDAEGHLTVHTEVVLLCACVIAVGTYFGGGKIITKIGHQLGENIVSWQGCTAETAASIVIFFASSLGIPISTTHVVVSAIAGAHASLEPGRVRWYIAGEIVLAWVWTFPVCWLIAFVAAFLANQLSLLF